MMEEYQSIMKNDVWGVVSPRETCHIFASFFMSPQFLCPLLGSFSAHGFCQWFSISD
jgi:hypothetical protein